MKRGFAVLLACAGLALPASAGSTVARPALRVTDLSPFTVQGLHFKPGELVTVTASVPTKGRFVRKRTATVAGRFVVVLRLVVPDPCIGYGVRAVGSRGSLAVIKRAPSMCPPPPQND